MVKLKNKPSVVANLSRAVPLVVPYRDETNGIETTRLRPAWLGMAHGARSPKERGGM